MFLTTCSWTQDCLRLPVVPRCQLKMVPACHITWRETRTQTSSISHPILNPEIDRSHSQCLPDFQRLSARLFCTFFIKGKRPYSGPIFILMEWRARIAPASISKQCIFCLPNTSESVKHKFWDCIQVRGSPLVP
jgi:hypothetical protein